MLQMSHASFYVLLNATRSVTRIATTSIQAKVLIFKPKPLNFNTTEVSYINFFPKKIYQMFGFWENQGLKLSINACFLVFKSSLAVNSHVAKPGRLALSKI